jgi:hypothetical protein
MAQTASEEYDNDDPCSLLDPKEVEAVLGAPLGAPPYRSKSGPGTAAVDGDSCVYETADFHYIQLGVEFTGGRTAYSFINMTKGLLGGGGGNAGVQHAVKQAFKLDDGTELAGEWDEATLMPMNCCIFVALRGDQKIEIDFTGSDATLKQAASLVDAAFKRIDKPLKIDGGANTSIAAARELEKHRVKPVDPCTLLPRAEVEAVIGKLTANPVSKGTDSCSYELPTIGIRRIYELDFKWRGGYYEWRSHGHTAAIGVGALSTMSGDAIKETRQGLGGKAAAKGHEAESEADAQGAATEVKKALDNKTLAANDAWEHAEFQAMDFAAVKKDVLVKINLLGVKADDATLLVAAAMRKF